MKLNEAINKTAACGSNSPYSLISEISCTKNYPTNRRGRGAVYSTPSAGFILRSFCYPDYTTKRKNKAFLRSYAYDIINQQEGSAMKEDSFELLTKLYEELSTFRKETTEKLTAIDHRTLRIENEQGQKIEATLDGYNQVYEKLLDHDRRFDSIEAKLETHDVQIGVLKKNA